MDNGLHPALQRWAEERQRARTDLLWLLREVLQYRDVEEEVHQPIIDKLQKFQGGVDYFDGKRHVGYRPSVELWHLKGPRRCLVLDPRGFLKTTIITMGHGIQWIINYPDIRLLFSMATGDQVMRVMQEVLFHFRFNERFRHLFLEFCPPPRKAKEFGNNEGFTVPCRRRKWMKEPTVSTCSVGKVIASGHYEVIKHSDLVDKENVKTPNQVADVISHFRYMNPLLERGPIPPHHGWIDVEGTRYDYSDLYGHTQDEEANLSAEKRSWVISVRAAEEDGKALWPTRFPIEQLRQIERDVGPYIYSCQYLNKPIPVGSGLAGADEIAWIPRKVLREIKLRKHMTVDLAGMDSQSKSSDFTVLTTAGFDNDGRMNVMDIRCGRYSVDEVIELLFLLTRSFSDIEDIKIEREAHARVLLPFLKREQSKRGRFLPPIVEIQRDNRTSKKQRIKALQPFFRAGLIRFADDLSCKTELIQQITRFSDTSSYHDDILDTLADQLQNREGGATADLYPDEPHEIPWGKPKPMPSFLGFEPGTGRELWSDGWAAPSTDTGVARDRTGL